MVILVFILSNKGKCIYGGALWEKDVITSIYIYIYML